jgi:uncharacterized repeat protein (TIGR03803 family)
MRKWALFNVRGSLALSSSVFLLTACGGSLGLPSNGAPLRAASRGTANTATTSSYKLLYAFNGSPDGASPYSGLVEESGLLYGTTLNGSSNYCSQSCGSNNCYLGCGTVFSVDGSGNEQIVYNFKGNFDSGQDGSWPFAGLTSLNGNLYGTTSSAGEYGHGVVYTVGASGSESVLYSFSGTSGSGGDGSGPEAPLTAYKSRLFGTTVYGGSGCSGAGCGTVYSLTTAGKESVLYRFKGGKDGNRVYAGLSVEHGKFYGATLLGGGAGCGSLGCGTIFEVTPNGKERVLYRFTGSSDGAYPNGLVAVKGVLYGTTEGAGSKNSGTFFSVTRTGKLTTLYNFQDIPDGNLPGANLIYLKGNFYGTTVGGGTAGDGTVFKVSPSGKESVLHSFVGGSDGSDPQGPVYASSGALYGTTTKGGNTACGGSGCGTIFKVGP